MPPNNFLVPASTAKTTDDGGSSNDEQTHEVNTRLLNRKSKNVLNANEKMKRMEIIEKVQPVAAVEEKKVEEVEEEFKVELVWINIFGFIVLHYWFFKGTLELGFNKVSLFNYLYGMLSGFGITAGAHRLWAHGAFKANLALKILLAFFQTIAFQNSIYEWSRDHRSHHKFTDTNADPHSASRGFFFAHMGWLMCKKHPDVKKFGKKIDMSDLERDPVCAFQRKYYWYLMPICNLVIPISISMYFFGVSFSTAFYLNAWRYGTSLHSTWLVNSYAHFYGTKPFDKNIKPTDSYTVALLAFGEGWHNYHHVFPYDYKTSDHNKYWCNFTTGILDFMAWIGWATDLKMIDPNLVSKRALRTGDGSHISSRIYLNNNYEDSRTYQTNEHIWGWQDETVCDEEKQVVKIINNTESSL
ncbi:acyl-CoA Delta12-desaturase-like [Chironomus tepperi]|uniref:acyl-CoA Delta12-desaturase-like n=1 Tax=Chironomus tepperi TaxID=113505 RepID=UPI00391F2135